MDQFVRNVNTVFVLERMGDFMHVGFEVFPLRKRAAKEDRLTCRITEASERFLMSKAFYPIGKTDLPFVTVYDDDPLSFQRHSGKSKSLSDEPFRRMQHR